MSHSKLKLMYTEVRNNPFLIATNIPFSLWLGEIFGMQVIGDNPHPDINRGFTVSGVNPRIGGRFVHELWCL